MGEEKSEGRRSRRVGNGRNTEKYETMVLYFAIRKRAKGRKPRKKGWGTEGLESPTPPPPPPPTHTPNLLVKEQASKRTVRACIIHSPVQ